MAQFACTKKTRRERESEREEGGENLMDLVTYQRR